MNFHILYDDSNSASQNDSTLEDETPFQSSPLISLNVMPRNKVALKSRKSPNSKNVFSFFSYSPPLSQVFPLRTSSLSKAISVTLTSLFALIFLILSEVKADPQHHHSHHNILDLTKRFLPEPKLWDTVVPWVSYDEHGKVHDKDESVMKSSSIHAPEHPSATLPSPGKDPDSTTIPPQAPSSLGHTSKHAADLQSKEPRIMPIIIREEYLEFPANYLFMDSAMLTDTHPWFTWSSKVLDRDLLDLRNEELEKITNLDPEMKRWLSLDPEQAKAELVRHFFFEPEGTFPMSLCVDSKGGRSHQDSESNIAPSNRDTLLPPLHHPSFAASPVHTRNSTFISRLLQHRPFVLLSQAWRAAEGEASSAASEVRDKVSSAADTIRKGCLDLESSALKGVRERRRKVAEEAKQLLQDLYKEDKWYEDELQEHFDEEKEEGKEAHEGKGIGSMKQSIASVAEKIKGKKRKEIADQVDDNTNEVSGKLNHLVGDAVSKAANAKQRVCDVMGEAKERVAERFDVFKKDIGDYKDRVARQTSNAFEDNGSKKIEDLKGESSEKLRDLKKNGVGMGEEIIEEVETMKKNVMQKIREKEKELFPTEIADKTKELKDSFHEKTNWAKNAIEEYLTDAMNKASCNVRQIKPQVLSKAKAAADKVSDMADLMSEMSDKIENKMCESLRKVREELSSDMERVLMQKKELKDNAIERIEDAKEVVSNITSEVLDRYKEEWSDEAEKKKDALLKSLHSDKFPKFPKWKFPVAGKFLKHRMNKSFHLSDNDIVESLHSDINHAGLEYFFKLLHQALSAMRRSKRHAHMIYMELSNSSTSESDPFLDPIDSEIEAEATSELLLPPSTASTFESGLDADVKSQNGSDHKAAADHLLLLEGSVDVALRSAEKLRSWLQSSLDLKHRLEKDHHVSEGDEILIPEPTTCKDPNSISVNESVSPNPATAQVFIIPDAEEVKKIVENVILPPPSTIEESLSRCAAIVETAMTLCVQDLRRAKNLINGFASGYYRLGSNSMAARAAAAAAERLREAAAYLVGASEIAVKRLSPEMLVSSSSLKEVDSNEEVEKKISNEDSSEVSTKAKEGMSENMQGDILVRQYGKGAVAWAESLPPVLMDAIMRDLKNIGIAAEKMKENKRAFAEV